MRRGLERAIEHRAINGGIEGRSREQVEEPNLSRFGSQVQGKVRKHVRQKYLDAKENRLYFFTVQYSTILY